MIAAKVNICMMGSHVLDRIAYRLLLERELGESEIVEADFTATAVWAALRQNPGLVIVHVDGESADLSAALDMLGRLRPEARVVAVADRPWALLQRARENETIHGVVDKRCGRDELCQALSAVLSGQTFTSTTFQQHWAAAPGGRRQGRAALSRREQELLPLLASGLTLREAAQQMAISYKTADSYRTNLFRKLGLRDRVELARYAIREQIIEA